MGLLARLFSRRQVLFALIMLPILPFSSGGLICRSDPIIRLSNGLIMEIGATIDGSLQDIQEIHYDIHVPKGVTLTSYESTPLWEKTRETFKLIPDQPANRYSVTVMLKLSKGVDSYIADGSLTLPNGVTYGPYTTAGQSGKPFTVSFTAGYDTASALPNGAPPPAPSR